jgi:biopolymer transport protein ExbB
MEALWHLLEYVRQGGWIMIPLGAVSIVMWLLIAERWRTFRELRSHDVGIQAAVHAVEGRSTEGTSNSRARGLRAQLVRDFLAKRTGDRELDKEILRQCALKLKPELTRFLAVIAVLAGIAPLLGLLGTVIGMIETFDVISLFGTGNAKALAGGISVALVTTQSGLLIAIPGLLLSAWLSKQASALARNLEEITLVLQHHV